MEHLPKAVPERMRRDEPRLVGEVRKAWPEAKRKETPKLQRKKSCFQCFRRQGLEIYKKVLSEEHKNTEQFTAKTPNKVAQKYRTIYRKNTE